MNKKMYLLLTMSSTLFCMEPSKPNFAEIQADILHVARTALDVESDAAAGTLTILTRDLTPFVLADESAAGLFFDEVSKANGMAVPVVRIMLVGHLLDGSADVPEEKRVAVIESVLRCSAKCITFSSWYLYKDMRVPRETGKYMLDYMREKVVMRNHSRFLTFIEECKGTTRENHAQATASASCQ